MYAANSQWKGIKGLNDSNIRRENKLIKLIEKAKLPKHIVNLSRCVSFVIAAIEDQESTAWGHIDINTYVQKRAIVQIFQSNSLRYPCSMSFFE